MQATRTALLFTGLLYLTCLPAGLSEPEGLQSGTFHMEDYNDWLKTHSIKLVNYVAEVGTNVAILSPIAPAPADVLWLSLNINGELPRPVDREVVRVGSTYLDKFQETYNTSWHNVFKFDKLNRWLRIRNVHHGYADLFRVFVGGNRTGDAVNGTSTEGQSFDVAITLLTFEKHECGFSSKPQNPKAGDTLTLSCSVIVNGPWNASLVIRSNYDDSEIAGETKRCGLQPSIGSKICNTVKVTAETDIPVLAYRCQLEFPSNERHDPKNPLFENSKWTAEFDKNIACNFQTVYLEAIPSEVTWLCNNMPCEATASVNDTVTCMAHGYPQPVFDLRIKDVSVQGNSAESREVDYESQFFMDTAEEERDTGSGVVSTSDTVEAEIKGYENIQIGPKNVGQIEITCNVSNALGWGYSSLVVEVKLDLPGSETYKSGKPTFNLEDYKDWRKKHRITLVNYVTEVGTDVLILSPITPPPIGISWFSRNMDGELPRLVGKEGGLSNSTYLKKFQETYNASWQNIFDYDKLNRWLKIKKVHLGYADVFRVFFEENRARDASDRISLDVAITLMTYEKHECCFASKPLRQTEGGIFILNCSVIVNGLWNASLVFRNNYDESETKGKMFECDSQPNTGFKICSTAEVKAETEILSYSCHLQFPSNEREDPKTPMLQNSKWTDKFNKDAVCYLPQVYLEAIPSDVMFLCNNMPCGDVASVGDTVTCVAHGYPQPVFDLRIQRFALGHENQSKSRDFEVNYDTIFFMDTSDETSEAQIRGSENYQISQTDVGRVEISCNVSNALGWGYNSLAVEVKVGVPESARNRPGTFHVEDYTEWLGNFTINLVNYVAEVETDVVIMSPITPTPVGLRWFSRNLNGELPHVDSEEVSLSTSAYFEEFLETYNSSWNDVFEYDEINRFLRIQNVRLGYADAFRVFVTESPTGGAVAAPFDVTFTLTIFEKHICGFTSKPQNPKIGDTLLLSCSVVVNGFWNTFLVFRNNYDQIEITGETRKCGHQPVIGSKICSTVNVKVDTDILAYSCRLEFSPSQKQHPTNAMFNSSKWTAEFNKNFDCYLPKIYLEVVPSEISFLCNNMPCEETALVNDTVTCLAHGYPPPVFDLRIQNLSSELENAVDYSGYDYHYPNFMDTVDEKNEVEIKGSESYRLKRKDVGPVEIRCNVSNALGWGYNSLVLEVKLAFEGTAVRLNVSDPGASTNVPFIDGVVTGLSSSDNENETDTNGSGGELSEGFPTLPKDPKTQILCNHIKCGENHTLFVDDEISCNGVESKHFKKFMLKVNNNTTEGNNTGVSYVLQMADTGYQGVECTAVLTSGGVLVKSLPIMVRGNKIDKGAAAGEIDVGQAESIAGKPPADSDSGAAAGNKDVPKSNDGMSADKADPAWHEHDVGNSGQESFFLLELFLVFIGVLFGHVQF